MDNLLISVIIPCYNDELYIEAMINSVLNQSYDNYEIIFIDDGSTDNSVSILIDILNNRSFKRYKIIKQDNIGVSEARNVGIKEARGKYLYFLDADDFINKDLFKKVNEFDKISDFDIFFFRFLKIKDKIESSNSWDEDCSNVEKLLKVVLTKPFMYCMCSVLIKREIVINNGLLFTKDMKYGEDSEFIIKALVNSNRAITSNYIGFNYNINKNSVTEIFDINRRDSVYSALSIEKYIKESRHDKAVNIFAKSYVARKVNYNLQKMIVTKGSYNKLSKKDKLELLSLINSNKLYLKYFKYDEKLNFKSFIISKIASKNIWGYIIFYKLYLLLG